MWHEMLTSHEARHSRADIERLYYHRKEEGSVLMETERTYVVEIMKQMEHMVGKEDLIKQIVRAHKYNMNSKLLRTVKNFKKSFQYQNKGVGTVIAQTIKEMRKYTSIHG